MSGDQVVAYLKLTTEERKIYWDFDQKEKSKFLSLTKAQLELYQAFLTEGREMLFGKNIKKSIENTFITRLFITLTEDQAAAYPKLTLEERKMYFKSDDQKEG